MTHLLTDIIMFCDRHKMAHATFGRAAMRDSRLIVDMLGGRSPGDKAKAAIREFMRAVEAGERSATYEPPQRDPARPRVHTIVRPPKGDFAYVDRDPCFRCGVRKDRHDDAGCGRWR